MTARIVTIIRKGSDHYSWSTSFWVTEHPTIHMYIYILIFMLCICIDMFYIHKWYVCCRYNAKSISLNQIEVNTGTHTQLLRMMWESPDQMQDGSQFVGIMLSWTCKESNKSNNPTSYCSYLLWIVRRLVSQHPPVIISCFLRVSFLKIDWRIDDDNFDTTLDFHCHMENPENCVIQGDMILGQTKGPETIRNGLQLFTALEGAR